MRKGGGGAAGFICQNRRRWLSLQPSAVVTLVLKKNQIIGYFPFPSQIISQSFGPVFLRPSGFFICLLHRTKVVGKDVAVKFIFFFYFENKWGKCGRAAGLFS